MRATFPFFEGQYFVTFTGTDKGNIFCHSVQHLKTTLETIFPNPGDPDYEALANPAKWQGDDNGFPYYVEHVVTDADRGNAETTVRIYRVMDLES